MDYILEGILEALNLLISFDSEAYGIIFLSLFVSYAATLISAVVFVPFGIYLGLAEFKAKKLFSRFLYAFMSVPSVVVGLFVAIMLSRRGPLGCLQLLYTPSAMVIAQFILVSPLIMSLVFSMTIQDGKILEKYGKTLGASKLQIILLIIREKKLSILVNITAGFSKAISEVGAAMIVGGNIKGHTRVITTTIAMSNSMGDYPFAIALGIVLLLISLVNSSFISNYREGIV